jgi:hypothetical protein
MVADDREEERDEAEGVEEEEEEEKEEEKEEEEERPSNDIYPGRKADESASLQPCWSGSIYYRIPVPDVCHLCMS